jgi:aminoglycoside phosphotransferase (APT) family kinase protein
MGSRSRDSVAVIRQMVAAQLPDHRVHTVVQVGEGTDNLTYEVNGELIVRCSKEPGSAARAENVDREARLLAAVAGIAPLPVPAPSFTIPEQGCLAYRKLPGVALLDLPQPPRSAHDSSIAATLGELLTSLHAAPVEHMATLVGVDDQPLVQWQREAAQAYATVAGKVPVVRRRPVEAFLDSPPPAGGWVPVFSHNDLGIEHVLVDPGSWTVTGVIDWSDAAIVDPAVDFGLLYRDLGPGRRPRRHGQLSDRGQRSRGPRGARPLLCQVQRLRGPGLRPPDRAGQVRRQEPCRAGVAVPGVAAQRSGGRCIHRSLPSPSSRHGTGAGSGQLVEHPAQAWSVTDP